MRPCRKSVTNGASRARLRCRPASLNALLLILVGSGLCGCGQKGPLELAAAGRPTERAAAPVSPFVTVYDEAPPSSLQRKP